MSKNKLYFSNQTSLNTYLSIKNKQSFILTQKPFIIERKKSSYLDQREKSSKSKWSNGQKSKFFVFVFYFKEIIIFNLAKEIKWNFFKAMNKFIVTRNPQQCRSYFLKIAKIFGTIHNFIQKAIKKVQSLTQQIKSVSQRLSQLKQQFKLDQTKQIQIETLIKKQNYIKEPKEQRKKFCYGSSMQKCQIKNELKTADSYYDEEVPVKSFSTKLSFFSNQSQFKPFTHKLAEKSSLPSFKDFQHQPVNYRNNVDQNHPTQIIIMKQNTNQEIRQNLSYLRPFSTFPIFQSNKEEEDRQNINNLINFQYYYQFWAYKLNQAFQQSNNQQR